MKFKFALFLCLFFYVGISFSQEEQISNLKIRGAKKTKASLIKKLLATKANSSLDSALLDKDIINLKRLPGIGHAYYQVFKSKDNLYNVFIDIEENFTIIPDINFWTTTNEQFAYKIGLYDYNFLGQNIAFGGFYQNNGFDSYGINFRAPTLFSKKWGIALSHQDWKSKEPLYFDNGSANYLYNNVSYEILGLYQMNLKNQFHFGLNFFNEKYQYISGDTDASIPLSLDVNKVLYKFVYQFNNLTYYYQYIEGFKSELYGQFVTSNNSFQNNFLIFWNDFFFYKRYGEKGNWASRLRFGLASNEDSPFAPFALDNNVNIRGVGILVDRGTGSVVLNTEYRHTLYDKKSFAIQANGFLDAGSWRNPGGDLNDFFQQKNMRIFTGLGMRFISKKIYNATFRIDYGFSLTEKGAQGLVFGLGQYF